MITPLLSFSVLLNCLSTLLFALSPANSLFRTRGDELNDMHRRLIFILVAFRSTKDSYVFEKLLHQSTVSPSIPRHNELLRIMYGITSNESACHHIMLKFDFVIPDPRAPASFLIDCPNLLEWTPATRSPLSLHAANATSGAPWNFSKSLRIHLPWTEAIIWSRPKMLGSILSS